MAAFTKFQDFIERLGTKQRDLNADTFRVFLTNEAPVAASDTVKGGHGRQRGMPIEFGRTPANARMPMPMRQVLRHNDATAYGMRLPTFAKAES